ncbi:hypothetical protein M422DRAFT_243633 [Sphaerobolus stellatus SS14]|nr:hypothetical protein M422DRAFT_243633 [Sphaerobolus stellatus SS14]
MRIRQYSISSSPFWNATRVSITLSIVQLPNEAGLSNKFLGVASNYLAKVCTGDQVQVGIRSSTATFYLPEDPSVLSSCLLLDPGLHPSVVSSNVLNKPNPDAIYVQDRVLYDKELIYEYFLAGAKFYTCGSPPVANALKESLISLVKIRHADWDDERLARKWESI